MPMATFHKSRTASSPANQYLRRLASTLNGKPCGATVVEVRDQIRRVVGVALPERKIEYLCRRHGVGVVRATVYPWHLMNWELANADLQSVWGVPHNPTVARRRGIVRAGRARWCGQHKGRFADPAHAAAMESERSKAKAWRQLVSR
jgi:hypothetical protein